ncbi:MAG: molybdenum ABC transporter ATP-binding protein [Candidatus Binataceae bacterium]
MAAPSIATTAGAPNAQPEVSRSPVLSVRVVKKQSEGFCLDAEFFAPPGFNILFGASGSGKTTLLDSVAGLTSPDAGRIALGDRVFFDSRQRIDVPVGKRKVGYLVQNLALFPHLTIEQNVQYGLARMDTRSRRERTAQILESFQIAHLARRKPAEVSGGERQRAALARSLVIDPTVLLLDEPLSALDSTTKSKIIDDLRAWNASHAIPIIYVTHATREAYALGAHMVVLESGRVLAQGTPNDVLAAPKQETVANLAGFENVFDAAVTAVNEEYGTMLCRPHDSEIELEVPLARAIRGQPVRIAIRAGDIMVATEHPSAISARNVFAGRILNLDRMGATVIIVVDAGAARFESHLTPKAVEELRLEPGRQVWLVVKTYSCHLVERSSPQT